MIFLQPPSTPPLQPPFLFHRPLSSFKSLSVFPSKPQTLSLAARSSPNTSPTNDQDILRAVEKSDGETPDFVPAVRSYENDLSRLSVVGPVDFRQALTAAAADGGEAAEEHISSGVSTMVIETLFPGSPDERSTIATRLFLPARKVKEKASKLRSSLTADMLASTTSRNILAMTFRQVVLQHIWSFELVLFSPGTERNMEDLANPREVPPSFTLSSSDKRVLSALAEAVCSCALESTEGYFIENIYGRTSSNVFPWFRKPKRMVSSDSSVYIYKISEDEIVQNAKKLIQHFSSVNGRSGLGEKKPTDRWWVPPAYSRLNKIGGPEFSAWMSEHVAAYKLQIDDHKFEEVNFQGWQKSADNKWELFLTHLQMVGLASILDMYYEDQYCIPDKQLSFRFVVDLPKVSKSKSGYSLWKLFSAMLAGGSILVLISVLAQICRPHLFKAKEFPAVHTSLALSEGDCYEPQSWEATEVESLCRLVVEKIKEALGWSGYITIDPNIGAWTGELPSNLKLESELVRVQEGTSCIGEAARTTSSNGDVQTHAHLIGSVSSPTDESATDSISTVQDISSYQVVLSRDGKIIGFMPTSRVAVNHWASNPLSRALYQGRKLSPGLLEPGLKVHSPHEVVQLELLMSVNPALKFALARPVR